MHSSFCPSLSTRRAAALALVCAATLALAACHRTPPPPSNVTPQKAVATNLRLTAAGDFDGLMQNRLPPADYTQWRREWDAARAQPAPSAASEQQFDRIMQMLTAPNAEAQLAKRLAPQLANLKGGHNNLPVADSILDAAGRQIINESPQLGPVQRSLALQTLDAVIAWAKVTNFSHPKQGEKAIAIICTTARALHVTTLAQWRQLDYATTMKNYGIIWRGLASLLQVYGLDLDKSFADASISTVTDDGSHATVKLDLTIAGQKLSGGWPMVRQDGHWYDEALLDAWAKAHPPAPAVAATAAPAPAVSVPTIPIGSASTAAPTSSATASHE